MAAARDRWVKNINYFDFVRHRPDIFHKDVEKHLLEKRTTKFYVCYQHLLSIAEFFSHSMKTCYDISQLLLGSGVFAYILFENNYSCLETVLRLMRTFLNLHWYVTEEKLRDVLCFYLLHVHATNFPQEFEHAQKVLKSLQSNDFDPFQWRDDLWMLIDVVFHSEYWRSCHPSHTR